MANTLETETVTEATPDTTAQQAAEEAAEQTAQPDEKIKEKETNRSSLLLPILTILLVIVGVCELALCGYIGLTSFRSSQARKQYEAEQAELQQQAGQSTGASSICNPWLTVENGVVVWRSEEGLLLGGGQSQDASSGAGSAKRLAEGMKVASPPSSWVRLVSYDRDWPDGKLLGTVNSDKYHSYNCQAAQIIQPKNELWYDSVEAARATGRSPCRICYG